MRQSTTGLTITHEQINLLAVTGRLDWAGLQALQKQLDLLLDAGARFLLADLSRAEHRDDRLSDLLARTSALVARRGGWLRLIGPGSSVLSTVEPTMPPAVLSVDHTPDQAHLAVGYA